MEVCVLKNPSSAGPVCCKNLRIPALYGLTSGDRGFDRATHVHRRKLYFRQSVAYLRVNVNCPKKRKGYVYVCITFLL